MISGGYLKLPLTVMPFMAAVNILVGINLWAFSEKSDLGKSATAIAASGTNPHYTGRYCSHCHEAAPHKGMDNNLKYSGNYKRLCRCHIGVSGNYIHPVGMAPSEDKTARIPQDFPLQNGRLACITCHDIARQCRKRLMDKVSLRGAPYPRRSDFCFKCHNRQNYMMLNAHDQLDTTGRIIAATCRYCHTEKPDPRTSTYDVLNFVEGFETMCQKCHIIRGNHSGNFNHMVKPSIKGLSKIKMMAEKFGIILPLDGDGRMTCITCHNPHAKGVIPENRAAARGAGSNLRHRLPGKMCVECHQM